MSFGASEVVLIGKSSFRDFDQEPLLQELLHRDGAQILVREASLSALYVWRLLPVAVSEDRILANRDSRPRMIKTVSDTLSATWREVFALRSSRNRTLGKQQSFVG